MASTLFNRSGELMPPTAEELVDADKDTAILCYTNGQLEDGRNYYAYIAVKPSKYQQFKKLTDARMGLTLGEYGEIIAGDFEASPPPAVVAEMREKYGFDENFAEKVIQKFRREQTVFMEQKEKKRLDDIVAMLKKKQATNGGSRS